MGIEPTWERLHAPTPDLKSGSPTSELGASVRQGIYTAGYKLAIALCGYTVINSYCLEPRPSSAA